MQNKIGEVTMQIQDVRKLKLRAESLLDNYEEG